MKQKPFSSLFFVILLVMGFGSAKAEQPARSIFVSIPPLRFLAERIAGEGLETHVLVPPGRSPATYEPTARQMAQLSEASLFFRVGVPFENALLPKINSNMPHLQIVDLREGIALREMEKASDEEPEHTDHHTEEQGHGHHHSGGRDPHIWLSPRLMRVQARTMLQALEAAFPEMSDSFTENFQKLDDDLQNLDAEIGTLLKPLAGRTLLVFHPSWGYFADAYGLQQKAIEYEGKEPTGRHLARVVGFAQEQGIRAIFVQPQFSRASATRIARIIEGEVVVIDPLAEDYLQNLLETARAIQASLQEN